MAKKLIKKGQWGTTAPYYQSSIQPLTYNSILDTQLYNERKINDTLNLGFDKPSSIPKLSTAQGYLKSLPNSNVSTKLTKTLGNQSGGLNLGNMGSKGSSGASIAGVLGGVADTIGSMVPDKTDNSTTAGLNQGHAAAADVLGKIPTPWTQIASAAMKGQAMSKKLMDNWTHGATSIENAQTTSDKIMNSNWLAGSGISELNAITATKIKGGDKDLAKSVNYGYNATYSPKDSEIGGITKLFGGKKVKNKIAGLKDAAQRANRENALKTSSLQQNNKNMISAQNTMQDVISRNNQQLLGGQNLRTLVAQRGAKLAAMQIFIQKNNPKMNVIPEGALHKNKHKINSVLVDNATTKGIPVIAGDLTSKNGILVNKDGGEITQTAEIERNEIIFHKEVTKKLEEGLKEYNSTDDPKKKKEIELELGKLLVFEILENTEDRTNLIETI